MANIPKGKSTFSASFLRPGDVAIDVGANIGALTVPWRGLCNPAARSWRSSRSGAIFDILCNNLRLNGLVNVTAFRRAVGSKTGTIRVPPLDYGRADNFGGVALGGASGDEVQLVTIDSLALPRLRLLKVDVEGMEHDVITGARATIGRLRPALYVENDRAEHSRALISLLFDIGYRLWWHITPLFNPKNFFGNPQDIFSEIVSFNMIGFPRADAPVARLSGNSQSRRFRRASRARSPARSRTSPWTRTTRSDLR